MVEQFIEAYAKKIVHEPDKIKVTASKLDESSYEIHIFSSPADAGRLIGKDGKMVSALKVFLSGIKAKSGLSYRITIKPL